MIILPLERKLKVDRGDRGISSKENKVVAIGHEVLPTMKLVLGRQNRYYEDYEDVLGRSRYCVNIVAYHLWVKNRALRLFLYR